MAGCGETADTGQGDAGGEGVVERGEGDGMGQGGRVQIQLAVDSPTSVTGVTCDDCQFE